MRYISSVERLSIEQGIKIGSKGSFQEMLLFALNNKFGAAVSQHITERVKLASQQELKNWLEKIIRGEFELAEIA